jgi:putative transposase
MAGGAMEKSSGHLRAPKAMRFQFIEEHRDEFPVTRMCQVLDVSTSGYYAWRNRPASAREMANRALVERIKEAHTESHKTYGSPRVYRELKAQGVACSENRVARLMRQAGIQAKQFKRRKRTTKANDAHPVAPNELNGDFTASRPDEKWVTDITYIATREGWLYLACVLDLFSRCIVGWAMSARMTSELVVKALRMAIRQRKPSAGLLHHSDKGSQYTGQTYQQLLRDNQMVVSMSGTGNCFDNAVMESFFGTLKREHVHHCVYRSREEAQTDLFFYIEGFYNRRRRHSALGYLSPDAYEKAHYHQLKSCLTHCPQN